MGRPGSEGGALGYVMCASRGFGSRKEREKPRADKWLCQTKMLSPHEFSGLSSSTWEATVAIVLERKAWAGFLGCHMQDAE